MVEDTTGRRWRRQPPQPKVRHRIRDCANEISLWFEVDSPEQPEAPCTRSTPCSARSALPRRTRRGVASSTSPLQPRTVVAELRAGAAPLSEPVSRFRRGRANARSGLQPTTAALSLNQPSKGGVTDDLSAASEPAAGTAVGADPGHEPGRRTAPAASPGRWTSWTRLRRFLILGSEGGSYYAGEWKLTRENAQAVEQCLAADGARAVAEIVAISEGGRAPKNDPALFALAMAAGHGDEATRRAALEALPRVCRTSTHLFQFATFVEGFRGWGRSLRRAVGGWYAGRSPEALAYQAVKYRQREGMTHRDLLRLAHPAGRVGAGNPTLELGDEHRRLFEWIVRGGDDGRPAADRRGLRARAGGGDAGARGGARPRVRPAARGAPSRAPDLGRGLGGAARGHADDGARPQPRDDDPRRRARAGLGGHGEGGRAARRPRAHPQGARSPDRGAGGAAHVRGGSRCARPRHVDAGAGRSSTRSTPRSTRRSRTSSRRASACCSRSTCRARWQAAWSPACRA